MWFTKTELRLMNARFVIACILQQPERSGNGSKTNPDEPQHQRFMAMTEFWVTGSRPRDLGHRIQILI